MGLERIATMVGPLTSLRSTVIVWIAGLTALSVSGVAGQLLQPSGRSVRITAQQVRQDPPEFVFLVTNASTVPLKTIWIGSSQEPIAEEGPGILTADFNRPTSTTLPPGWVAGMTASNGTSFFGYEWRASDPSIAMTSGESRCDFRVTLPRFIAPSVPLFMGKAPAKQTDFQRVPFMVQWSDGRVYEGIVYSHLLRSR